LEGIGRSLPNSEILLRPLQNREAIRSSSLEGVYAAPEAMGTIRAGDRMTLS
jgi:hypothetical protein